MREFRLPIFGCSLIAIAVALGAELARAEFEASSERLATELKGVAASVVKVVGNASVTVGQTVVIGRKTSGGNFLKQSMVTALRRSGVKVTEVARYELEGRARVVLNDQFGSIIAMVELELYDTNDPAAPPIKISFVTADLSTILLLHGSILTLPYLGRDRREEALFEAIQTKEPRLRTEVSEIRSGDYAMEILVGPLDRETRKPSGKANVVQITLDEKGVASIPAKPDQYIEVRLKNYDAKFDAAVELFLDGVNMFSFSELTRKDDGRIPKNSHLLVDRARGNQPTLALVPGWHKNDAESFTFDVSNLPKDAETHLGKENGNEVGTITALVRQAWNSDEEGPFPALAAERGKGKRHGPILTSITVRYRRD